MGRISTFLPRPPLNRLLGRVHIYMNVFTWSDSLGGGMDVFEMLFERWAMVGS
jgi:hypothetical protein